MLSGPAVVDFWEDSTSIEEDGSSFEVVGGVGSASMGVGWLWLGGWFWFWDLEKPFWWRRFRC